MLFSSAAQGSSRSAPPILPIYKVASNSKASKGNRVSMLLNVALVVIPIILIMLFLSSIYMGTAFLEGHMQTKADSSSFFNIGLPNTRNEIKKWSMEHLHGIDITSLGPPVVKSNNTALTTSAMYRKYTNASMYRELYEHGMKANMGLFNQTNFNMSSYNSLNSFNYFRDRGNNKH